MHHHSPTREKKELSSMKKTLDEAREAIAEETKDPETLNKQLKTIEELVQQNHVNISSVEITLHEVREILAEETEDPKTLSRQLALVAGLIQKEKDLPKSEMTVKDYISMLLSATVIPISVFSVNDSEKNTSVPLLIFNLTIIVSILIFSGTSFKAVIEKLQDYFPNTSKFLEQITWVRNKKKQPPDHPSPTISDSDSQSDGQ